MLLYHGTGVKSGFNILKTKILRSSKSQFNSFSEFLDVAKNNGSVVFAVRPDLRFIEVGYDQVFFEKHPKLRRYVAGFASFDDDTMQFLKQVEKEWVFEGELFLPDVLDHILIRQNNSTREGWHICTNFTDAKKVFETEYHSSGMY